MLLYGFFDFRRSFSTGNAFQNMLSQVYQAFDNDEFVEPVQSWI